MKTLINVFHPKLEQSTVNRLRPLQNPPKIP